MKTRERLAWFIIIALLAIIYSGWSLRSQNFPKNFISVISAGLAVLGSYFVLFKVIPFAQAISEDT